MSERIQSSKRQVVEGIEPIKAYMILFGTADLIPSAWISSSKFKSVDDIYREAVKRGKTWREITGWNEDKKKKELL